ncbi:MAG: hypothetical protein HF967_08905 [Methanosarcinales archaeon]|nr:hypothetical protein [Methanosarcinales archaeon]
MGKKSLCGYLIALANEGGGKIILGVTDKKPRIIVGTNAFLDVDKLKSDIFSKIKRRVEIDEIYSENKRVLIISINSKPMGEPLNFNGQYLMRVGEELHPMSSDQLKAIFSEHINDYSAEVKSELTIEDLSQNAIKILKTLLKESKRVDFSVDKLTDLELLKNLNLIKNDKFTIASLVLLGTEDALQKYLPFSEIRFGYKLSLKHDRNQEMVIYRKAYLEYYDDIWKKINLRNHFVHIPKGLRLKEEYAFNEDSIREAINNAIIHRNYFENGSIIIQQTEEIFKVTNPGGFPKGVTEKIFFMRQIHEIN